MEPVVALSANMSFADLLPGTDWWFFVTLYLSAGIGRWEVER